MQARPIVDPQLLWPFFFSKSWPPPRWKNVLDKDENEGEDGRRRYGGGKKKGKVATTAAQTEMWSCLRKAIYGRGALRLVEE